MSVDASVAFAPADHSDSASAEMGLVEGTAVRFLIRAAPLGDPLEYEVQDYLLSLRRAEAALQIDIESADP